MLQLDFGPGHSLWHYVERGVQIVIGVSAVSLVTFLGEVWGGESVPYEAVFRGLWWFGYGFLIALLPTPLCWAVVPVTRRSWRQTAAGKRFMQAWAVASLILPLAIALWMFTRAAETVIFELAMAQGVDYETIDLFYDPDRDDGGLFGRGRE